MDRVGSAVVIGEIDISDRREVPVPAGDAKAVSTPINLPLPTKGLGGKAPFLYFGARNPASSGSKVHHRRQYRRLTDGRGRRFYFGELPCCVGRIQLTQTSFVQGGRSVRTQDLLLSNPCEPLL